MGCWIVSTYVGGQNQDQVNNKDHPPLSRCVSLLAPPHYGLRRPGGGGSQRFISIYLTWGESLNRPTPPPPPSIIICAVLRSSVCCLLVECRVLLPRPGLYYNIFVSSPLLIGLRYLRPLELLHTTTRNFRLTLLLQPQPLTTQHVML